MGDMADWVNDDTPNWVFWQPFLHPATQTKRTKGGQQNKSNKPKATKTKPPKPQTNTQNEGVKP